MMREIKRVLQADGIIIISTPDKYYHSDINSVKSKFHIKEIYKEDFTLLIREFYSNSIFLYQKSMFCSTIFSEKRNNQLIIYEGDYLKIESSHTFSPSFHIAIASDKEIPDPSPSSIFSSTLLFQDILKLHELLVKKTLSYKTGNFMLSPFKKLRSIFLKK